MEKYDYIKDIQNQLKAEIISTNIKEDLDTFFAPKYDLKKNEKNQFYIYGHFDEMFPVNPSFCIWLNNKNLCFYYYNKENECKKTKYKNKSALSKKNFTLICSNYKLKKMSLNNKD